MSKCESILYITDGRNYTELDLDPQSYLHYDTEEEMLDAVKEDLDMSMDLGNCFIRDSEVEYTIPKDFINEWKKLKENE